MSAVLLAVSAFAADRVFDFRPQPSQPKTSNGKAVSALLSQRIDDVSVLRTHCVRSAAQESEDEVAVGDILTFQLFDDKEFRVRIVERLPSVTAAKSWMGVAEGYGETVNCVVVWTDSGWQLDVQDFQHGRVYRVFSATNGMASVCESDPNAVNKTCGNVTHLSVDAHLSADANTQIEDGKTVVKMADTTNPTYVDILVVFDTAAQSWCSRNGTTMTAFANTAVAKMNTALANTGLDSSFRYRLAGAWGISGYGGTDLEAVLDACEAENYYNGVDWGQVSQKRDEIGADVVTILMDIGDTSEWNTVTTGIGFCPRGDPGGGEGWVEDTYNCCAISYVANDHTMTHEVGHNMGCGHADQAFVNPRAISPGPGVFSYSSGFHFIANGTAYHTIMAYNFDGWGNQYVCCPYFSSPNYAYKGVAVGNALHDNNRTLKETFARVAALRNLKYKVKLYKNDGNDTSMKSYRAAAGIWSIPTVSSLSWSSSGKAFRGWSKSSTATTATYSDGARIAISGATTLYGVWAPAYTLTFNPNGGKLKGANFGTDDGTSNSHSVTVVYGAGSYSSMGTAVMDGGRFLGWYTAASGGDQVYGANGACVKGTKYWNSSGQWNYKGKVTLYAHWDTRPAYTLTFNPNGGKLKGANFGTDDGTSNSHSVTVVYGAGSYSSMGTAVMDGGRFLGWYTAASGGDQVYGANGACVKGTKYWNSSGQWNYKGKVTLYAHWDTRPAYTLTFNPNGGRLKGGNFGVDDGKATTHAVTVVLGAGSYSSIGTAVRDVGRFHGWYTAASGGEQVYGANGACVKGTKYWNSSGQWNYKGNVTLYAHWDTRPAYTLTFNPNGGRLKGGNFGADDGTSNSHSVTVVYGAGSYNSMGTAVRDVGRFHGWYTAASGGDQVYGANGVCVKGTKYWNSSGQWNYKGNVTLYAHWDTRPAYTLTFNPNGGKLNGTNFGADDGTSNSHSVTVVYGAGSYSSIGTATKAGSKFTGWYTSDGEQVYGQNGVFVAGRYWNSSGQWQHSGGIAVYARWSAAQANNVLVLSSQECISSSGDSGTGSDSAKRSGKVVVKSVESVYDGTVRWDVAAAPFWGFAGDMLRVTVGRVGGSAGRIAVKAEAQGCQDAPDLTAIIGEDLPYVGEILVWSDGETADKVIEIPTFHAGDASYPLYFRLKLSAQTTGEHEGCATPELPEAEVVIGLMDE